MIDSRGSGVICETRALPGAVIPAKAGIYSASRWGCPADGLDSHLRGNDERDAIPNDATTDSLKAAGTCLGSLLGSARGSFRTGLYLCALCVLCGCTAARADEFTETSHYSVRLFSYGTLVVDARMGDLRIEGWDEPRVEVEAEKTVRAGSAANASQLYDSIQVQLEGSDKEVRLRTLYPPRRLWRPLRDESRLSVNFHIKMPYDANLRLRCVDGDVRIIGIVGREELRVNYGDVEVSVPDVYRLRSLNAHTWIGYVQSDLHGLDQDGIGFRQRLSFWNSTGDQDILVRVRMGGVWVFGGAR